MGGEFVRSATKLRLVQLISAGYDHVDIEAARKADEDARHVALTQGQIAGAGLDVFVEEPPAPRHPLFALPNVTLTPHSAGPTWENWTARFRNGFDNIQRVATGDKPRWVIPELA